MDKDRELKLAKAIGLAIAEKRKQAQLTQEKVAEMLDVGYEAVSRMERGTVVPTISRLVELSEIFGCSVNDLIWGTSDASYEVAESIVKKLQPLSPHGRSVVMKIMDELIRGIHVIQDVGSNNGT